MDAVGYRMFLSRLISMLSLILCKFLAGAARFFVGAVHPIAGPWLRKLRSVCGGTREGK